MPGRRDWKRRCHCLSAKADVGFKELGLGAFRTAAADKWGTCDSELVTAYWACLLDEKLYPCPSKAPPADTIRLSAFTSSATTEVQQPGLRLPCEHEDNMTTIWMPGMPTIYKHEGQLNVLRKKMRECGTLQNVRVRNQEVEDTIGARALRRIAPTGRTCTSQGWKEHAESDKFSLQHNCFTGIDS